MRQFERIAIIGVGLIGGSVGLAIKKKGLAKEVVGIFRRRSTLVRALRHGAIDRGTLDLKDGVSGASLVVVATNVGTIAKLAKKALPFMKRGSVLTDAGSVKADIAKEIEAAIPSGVSFVGAHPMAGSEKAGVEFASDDLFENALVILTKTKNTDKRALDAMARFWRSLGAKVVIMRPDAHDRRVAMISHLPHMAALGLCLAQSIDDLPLAAGGFKDTTRTASSDPEMWRDILEANARCAIRALDRFSKEIARVRRNIYDRDFDALLGRMKRAKAIRDSVR